MPQLVAFCSFQRLDLVLSWTWDWKDPICWCVGNNTRVRAEVCLRWNSSASQTTSWIAGSPQPAGEAGDFRCSAAEVSWPHRRRPWEGRQNSPQVCLQQFGWKYWSLLADFIIISSSLQYFLLTESVCLGLSAEKWLITAGKAAAKRVKDRNLTMSTRCWAWGCLKYKRSLTTSSFNYFWSKASDIHS